MSGKVLKVLMFVVVISFQALESDGQVPKAWFAAGSHPKEYEMSIDRGSAHSGKASAYLKSVVPRTSGFGTMMQTFRADAFRGKRVRMSGFVKSQDADGAGLWMRVDGAKSGDVLAFDNMDDRSIRGTTDWKKYEIVLDVPEESEVVAFGLLLAGRGKVWVDDLRFDVVGKEVPTTGGGRTTAGPPKAPSNLNFED